MARASCSSQLVSSSPGTLRTRQSNNDAKPRAAAGAGTEPPLSAAPSAAACRSCAVAAAAPAWPGRARHSRCTNRLLGTKSRDKCPGP